jgi:hypothetical protein
MIGNRAMICVKAAWPQNVKDQLQTQYLRVKAFASAELLWQRVLTAGERTRLGDHLVSSYRKLGTVGMWREVRGGSNLRAIIETAYSLNLLSEMDRVWLIREIEEEPSPTQNPLDAANDAVPERRSQEAHVEVRTSRSDSNRPSWHAAEGLLRIGETTVRSVRPMENPSNIQRILDAFQVLGWPRQIENPLPNGQQQLHEALRSLNENLSAIRFHASHGGKLIYWDLV